MKYARVIAIQRFGQKRKAKNLNIAVLRNKQENDNRDELVKY